MLKKTLKFTAVATTVILLIACSSNRPIRSSSDSSDSKNASVKYFDPTRAELEHVGRLIFRNETGQQRDKLAFWNAKEEFPSMGIGHFIWYPEGFDGLFPDSFPGLIQFFKSQGIEPPTILTVQKAPWHNRDAFEKARSRGELNEVIDFLESTKAIQVQYIFQRLEAALPKMMAVSDKPDHLKQQFERIANSPNGLYPLIDYVNFKGEGLELVLEYNNVAWGLRQVLEGMSGTSTGVEAFKEFSRSCVEVLTNRVKNQPSTKREQSFIPGWTNRCNSYISDT